MGTITERKGRFMGCVAIKGFDRQAKTFATKEQAQAWIDETEQSLRERRKNGDMSIRHEILNLKRLYSKTSFTGIYFLIQKTEIVYVGQAINVHTRVKEHIQGRGGKKEFDSYTWIPCDVRALTETENFYIKELKPVYNIAGTDRFDLARKLRSRKLSRLERLGYAQKAIELNMPLPKDMEELVKRMSRPNPSWAPH